jgi:hypothetical protein
MRIINRQLMVRDHWEWRNSVHIGRQGSQQTVALENDDGDDDDDDNNNNVPCYRKAATLYTVETRFV